jgi:hypothetical protein
LETDIRKNIRERIHESEQKKEETNLIHIGGGGRRSHHKRKMTVPKD